MRIQPRKSFESIDQLLEKTSNPAHRAMLENYKTHLTGELTCDIEGILATMSPHPVYHTYGTWGVPDGKSIDGPEQNRGMYQTMFDEGFNVLHMDAERLSVGDWGISGDGNIHIIYPGKALSARGIEVDDEGAHYLVSNRIAFFLPYENGLMAGEDTYMDREPVIVKLDPSEVVTPEEALQ